MSSIRQLSLTEVELVNGGYTNVTDPLIKTILAVLFITK